MTPKPWNALRASFVAAIIGAAYIAALIVQEGRTNQPVVHLIAEMLGGAMAAAFVVGLFAQARNWVTGARIGGK